MYITCVVTRNKYNTSRRVGRRPLAGRDKGTTRMGRCRNAPALFREPARQFRKKPRKGILDRFSGCGHMGQTL